MKTLFWLKLFVLYNCSIKSFGLLKNSFTTSSKTLSKFHGVHCSSNRKFRQNEIKMVFNFFKKRASEGIQQVGDFTEKVTEGRIGEAFEGTAEYIKQRREIDIENIAKFTEGLRKSREKFMKDINSALDSGNTLEATLSNLEEILMSSDIGVSTTYQILEDLREIAASCADEKLDADDVDCVLRGTLIQALGDFPNTKEPQQSNYNPCAINFSTSQSELPSVIFVMGANGMGKTTTIGKLAYRLREENKLKVLLCAADTFRAAAVEQLQEWAVRAGTDIVIPMDSDERPESVAIRSCTKAIDGKYDVLIVDTSGRLSNNRKLNQELRAIKNGISSKISGAPHETLLVVDANVGRNAFEQAKTWKKEVGVSGVAVTKLDGTARAGYVVSIAKELKIPIKLVGIGEEVSDLRDFDPILFVDTLLGFSREKAAELQLRYESNEILQERVRASMEKKNPNMVEAATSTEVSMNKKKNRRAKFKLQEKSKKSTNSKKIN
mmetsp:Transcript_3146/g.4850  ORF Transcript_3146/g.4850 Transcript_3146/m.4850 type:complete len:494 (+) Transcript_3146:97-1578(+)